MLCEIASSHALSPVALWITLCILGLTTILLTSGAVFYHSYVRATYDTWSRKTNPDYPSPDYVRGEILATVRGIGAATIPPALSIHLAKHGIGHAYCGVKPNGWAYLLMTFVFAVVLSDVYEWAYHRLGHLTLSGWSIHKHHHRYSNPSPFAVVADEPPDQLMRAMPLLLFPMTMPINMDMLFVTYSVIFYIYGVYLHWGHELSWPDAHHPFLNTAFQHYIHHAKSIIHAPYHTGFFVRLWDDLAGSVYPIERGPDCPCAGCSRKRGERSMERWQKEVRVPDYSVLLDWKFWIWGHNDKKAE